jgi:tripartite-type tricarboxylate transporter receptor subunit TctC
MPVPYRGTAQAMTDVVSGDLHCAFPSLTVGLQFVNSGKLRALGVTGSKRTPLAPQLATISESGLPGYQANIWNGLLVPARTPRAVIERLNSEVTRILAASDTRRHLGNSGSDAAPSSPEQFGTFIEAEIQRWAPVIKAAGITPQ